MLELDEASRAALRRRLRRSLRAGEGGAWRLVRDEHFEDVLEECARPREPGDGVWITERLQNLYRRLHEAGLAHSFEIEADGELAAGLVGVLLGRAAMLESMFHRVPDAGNVLLARTLDELAARGFVLCDIQLPTDHTRAWRRARAPRGLRAPPARRRSVERRVHRHRRSRAYSRPLRRSTRDHRSSGSSVKTSSRDARGSTIQDSSSISASS